MATQKSFKNAAFEAIHESALALHGVGAIDKATMRKFDGPCLAKSPSYEALQIKKIRQSENVSQHTFAMYLNTSQSTIQKWESGTQKPSGMALKLLDIVHKHGIRMLT